MSRSSSAVLAVNTVETSLNGLLFILGTGEEAGRKILAAVITRQPVRIDGIQSVNGPVYRDMGQSRSPKMYSFYV